MDSKIREDAGDDTIISCQDDLQNGNLLGRIVNGEDEAYKLYNGYGYQRGFSVRKGKQSYCFRTKKIRTKDYCCSKEGYKDICPEEDIKFEKLDTRTGCKAMVRYTIEDDRWTVTRFIDDHNHEMALPTERHLLRSVRAITYSTANVINLMVNAGIGTNNVFSYMSKEAGGSDKVGFTKKDCYNHVTKQKMSLIEEGDGQSLMNYFRSKMVEDVMFYYCALLDKENRVANFFWRDGRSRIDYDCFGDVVVFDTTYRTNRYGLICAPFVGVNHHWQNVMFGCAFLQEETTESFKWLFKSFLESMGNQTPKTIITDGDQAMGKAIEEVFPNTSHRLCLWHISKNAASHIGSLLSISSFKYLFNKCLQGCDSESEFEECWKQMMEGYEGARNSNWLNYLYNLRRKWSTALNKDTFSAGIKSSQRSESTNNVLNGIANKTTSLTSFVLGFEELVKNWRELEASKDYECKHGVPPLTIRNNGILKHAAREYTHRIFKEFQKEFLRCLDFRWTEVACHNNVSTFHVVGEHEASPIRYVNFDSSSFSIACSCKKFESTGYLCSHALRVLDARNIRTIPDQYILRRFTKSAKERRFISDQPEGERDKDEIDMVFRNRMLRMAYNIVFKCQGCDSMRRFCEDLFVKGNREVDKELGKINSKTKSGSLQDEDNANKENEAHLGVIVLDPSRKKGRSASNARLKGHFEKRKKKVAKNSSTFIGEVGSTTNGEYFKQDFDVYPNESASTTHTHLTWNKLNSRQPFTTMLEKVDLIHNTRVTSLDYGVWSHNQESPSS